MELTEKNIKNLTHLAVISDEAGRISIVEKILLLSSDDYMYWHMLKALRQIAQIDPELIEIKLKRLISEQQVNENVRQEIEEVIVESDKISKFSKPIKVPEIKNELDEDLTKDKWEEISVEAVLDEFIPLLSQDYKYKYSRNKAIDVISVIARDKPELVIEKLLPLLKSKEIGRRKLQYILNNIPLDKKLYHILKHGYYDIFEQNTALFLDSDGEIAITINPEGLEVLGERKVELSFDRESKVNKAAEENDKIIKIIFNAFYEYNINQNTTIFFESACNYKRPFSIKGMKLIQDIIPTSKYLRQDSRSLIDSQYKLSALNWAISIARKDEKVSRNEKHVFLILEGKSIFCTSILHRFELIQPGGKSIGEIIIKSEVNIKNEILEEYFQKILGNTKYAEKECFKKEEHYYAKTSPLDFEAAEKLLMEVKQDQKKLLKYNLRGDKAVTSEPLGKVLKLIGFKDSAELVGETGHSCFTWAREKLKNCLNEEEFEKLELTNDWYDRIIGSDPVPVLNKKS